MRPGLRTKGLAAVTVLALALSAGCTASSTERTAGTPLDFDDLVTTTEAGTTDAGTVRWNLPYEPLSLDPIKSFNYAENTALANACESLLRAEPGFGVGPALAEKWDNPDPTTWVYTLRQGVTFWNGRPLTADDVAWSIGRNLDPDSGSYLTKYFVNVEAVEATGPLEVTIRLKRPDALLNQALATMAGIVTEKSSAVAAGDEFGTPRHLPMCTGPFELEAWAAGDKLTMTRNEDYWDADLKATSSRLELTFIADESTAVLALRNGDIDGQYFFLPPAGLDQLRSGDVGDVVLGDSLIYWTLIAAATEGPFADPRVRQALLLATDRAALSEAVFQGAAIPAHTLAPPASWTYAHDTFERAYDEAPLPDADIDEATRLVEEANVTEPITIAVQGSSAVHEQTGNLLQAAAEAIGLDVEVKKIPVEQYGNLYVDPAARKGIDAFLSTYYGVADPLDSYTMFESTDYSNFTGYTEADDLLSAAREELDPERRADLVADLQEQIGQEVLWSPLAFLPVIMFQSKRVTGAMPSSNYLYYPWASGIGAR